MRRQKSEVRRPKFARAFTLIELLTVVAIIAVISVIAVPAIAALTKDNSRVQAGNQVRAYLSMARSLALAQHRMVGVVFFEETGDHALPVHGGRTAMQLFAEDFDQRRAEYRTSGGKYPGDVGNTVFVAYSTAREYLPAGMRVAALNDDPARQAMTGDDKTATLSRPEGTRGVTRAVLFDGQGQVIARHGLARPDQGTGAAGTYPRAYGDWNFATKTGDSHMGVSSPGVFLYDAVGYAAEGFAGGRAGDEARNAWLKGHANVVVVNANTGALLP
jgi:prepilin-type N-terminal cleavage/methylation domain-containing protein